jgi:hypothetical protein
MKFKIILNRYSNFYFFIQNLSEWSNHCRKEHNDFWKKQFDDFTNEEVTALKEFKDIRIKHRRSRSIFEHAFYKEENPWPFLEEKLNDREYKVIKNTFEILENKFETIYSKEITSLEKWKTLLGNRINQDKEVKEINDLIIRLYNTTPPSETMIVYLLISSPGARGGKANIDDRSVGVQISQSKQPVGYIVSLIWHEITHLFAERGNFFSLIEEMNIEPADKAKIKEFSITSLFPKGIMGREFFNVEIKKGETIRNDIPPEQGKKLLSITEEYVKEKKPFNEDYINKLLSLKN